MQDVIAANAEAVPVTGDDPDLNLGARGLEAGGDCGRAAVDAVEAVGVHVVGEAAAAADAGDEYNVLFGYIEVGHELLGLGEDGVVAAAGAPADFLVGDEVLAGEGDSAVDWRFCRHDTATLAGTSSLIFSSISLILKGLPVT